MWGRVDDKGAQGNFEDDGYVHDFECCAGFIDVHTLENSSEDCVPVTDTSIIVLNFLF